MFVRDLRTGQLQVVSTSGIDCIDASTHFNPALNYDARYVSFHRLDHTPTSYDWKSFVYDRQQGATRQSSLAGASGQPSGGTGSRANGVSADGRFALFSSRASNLVPDDINCDVAWPLGCSDVFVRDMFDDDGDTMTNDWETFFGLNPASAADAALDPDGDGLTNAEEFAAGSHPKGLASATRYFAEGASTDFFDTRIAVANPGSSTTASVLLRFVKPDGTFTTQLTSLPPLRSYQLLVDTLPAVAGSSFATVVETDVPVVADRLMWWGPTGAYGTHAEHSLGGAALTWHFAEGATHSGVELFFLVLNPNATS